MRNASIYFSIEPLLFWHSLVTKRKSLDSEFMNQQTFFAYVTAENDCYIDSQLWQVDVLFPVSQCFWQKYVKAATNSESNLKFKTNFFKLFVC